MYTNSQNCLDRFRLRNIFLWTVLLATQQIVYIWVRWMPDTHAQSRKCEMWQCSTQHSASLSAITSYYVWNIAVIDNTELVICFERRNENACDVLVHGDTRHNQGTRIISIKLTGKKTPYFRGLWERAAQSHRVLSQGICAVGFSEIQSAQSESLLFKLISHSMTISLLQSPLL